MKWWALGIASTLLLAVALELKRRRNPPKEDWTQPTLLEQKRQSWK